MLKVGEKQELVNNLLHNLPRGKEHGNAAHFMFERNYLLIVLYSLIQFRNYQASNFNIINLLFACYIVQKYLCRKFKKGLNAMTDVVQFNFCALEKTDEAELFFGKVGSNKLIEPDRIAQVYAAYTSKNLKVTTCFHARFFEEANLLSLTKQAYEQVCSVDDQSASQLKSVKNLCDDKQRKNIPYLKEIAPLVNVVLHLRLADIKKVVAEIKAVSETFNRDSTLIRLPTQNYGFCLALLSSYLAKNLATSTQSVEYVPSLSCVVNLVAKSAGQFESSKENNTNSNHARLFDLAFEARPHMRKQKLLKQAMAAFQVNSEVKFYRLLAIVCFSNGNVTLGCRVLNRVCKTG